MMKSIGRRIEVGVQTSRHNVLAGTLAAIFVLFALSLWYDPPEMSNPSIHQPNAVNSMTLPNEAVVVQIYSGPRGQWVSVHSTSPETIGFGSAYEVSEVGGLIREAVSAHPGFPVVVRGDRDAPFSMVREILDSLEAERVGMVYFETDNGPRESASTRP
jgi:biopolymer transport protein ExbD